MKIEIKDNCPLNGFKKCKRFNCAWYTQVKGKNPQTGEDIDEYACAITLNQAGAAIESFRNEMVKSNMVTLSTLIDAKNKKLGKE